MVRLSELYAADMAFSDRKELTRYVEIFCNLHLASHSISISVHTKYYLTVRF